MNFSTDVIRYLHFWWTLLHYRPMALQHRHKYLIVDGV